jgi:hypothetical protein
VFFEEQSRSSAFRNTAPVIAAGSSLLGCGLSDCIEPTGVKTLSPFCTREIRCADSTFCIVVSPFKNFCHRVWSYKEIKRDFPTAIRFAVQEP